MLTVLSASPVLAKLKPEMGALPGVTAPVPPAWPGLTLKVISRVAPLIKVCVYTQVVSLGHLESILVAAKNCSIAGGIPLAPAGIVSLTVTPTSSFADAPPSVQALRTTAPRAGRTDQRTLFFILFAGLGQGHVSKRTASRTQIQSQTFNLDGSLCHQHRR